MAGSPLMQTDLTGDSYGFALYGKFQDTTVVNDMASRAQLCVTFGILQGTGADSSVVKSYGSYAKTIKTTSTTIQDANWVTDGSVPVGPLDTTFLSPRQCWNVEQGGNPGNVSFEDRVQTFAIINDWNHQPSIFFRIDIGRNVLNLGITAMIIALAVLVVTLVIIAIVIIIFVERAVLYPVVRLTESVQDITNSGDVSQRVGKGNISKDELGTMTTCINLMLSSLDSAQDQIKHVLERTGLQEQRARAIMNAIPDFVICMLSNGIINHANVSFLERFQYQKSAVDDVLDIKKVVADMDVTKLIELSQNGKTQDGFLLTRYKDKIPVTISVSEITLFVKEEPTKAYVVIAKNNTEKNSLLEKLDYEKKRMVAYKQNAEFDAVMRNGDRRAALRNFCIKENSVENFNFLEAVEDYRAMKNVTDRIKKQKEIMETFLVNGDQQVNLSATTMDREVSLIKKGYAQLDLFDSLDNIVRTMIVVDTFQRFVKLPQVEQGIFTSTDMTSTDDDTLSTIDTFR
jgi:PAS domain-containing protein